MAVRTGSPAAARQRLLDSAVELFAQQGFAGSSVRDLARHCGLSLAGLYHHFSSKEEILFEIQREAFEQLLKPLEDDGRTLSPHERLALFVRNHIGFFSRQTTKMKLLSHELSALRGDHGGQIDQLRRRYYDICHSTVVDLLRELDRTDLNSRVTTLSLFGMINWIYRWYPRPHDPPPDRLADQMLELFLHGLAGASRGNAKPLNPHDTALGVTRKETDL